MLTMTRLSIRYSHVLAMNRHRTANTRGLGRLMITGDIVKAIMTKNETNKGRG